MIQYDASPVGLNTLELIGFMCWTCIFLTPAWDFPKRKASWNAGTLAPCFKQQVGWMPMYSVYYTIHTIYIYSLSLYIYTCILYIYTYIHIIYIHIHIGGSVKSRVCCFYRLKKPLARDVDATASDAARGLWSQCLLHARCFRLYHPPTHRLVPWVFCITWRKVVFQAPILAGPILIRGIYVYI